MPAITEEDVMDTVLVDRDGDGIVTVTFNRPHKLNAFTKPMWGRMGDVFRELGADESVRCVVIRGAGERAFGPGNDISEFKTDRSNARQAKQYGLLMHGTIQALKSMPHPTIAMIHGICVGGGLEIAGLCNIRICGESSRFGAPIAAHPECPPAIVDHADYVGSTSGILQFAETFPGDTLIVATEPHIIHQMEKALPEKNFIGAPGADGNCNCNICPYMALNTLEKLYTALRDLTPQIEIEEGLRMKAKQSLDRMLEMASGTIGKGDLGRI